MTPKKLLLKNFLSHSSSEIDFDKFDTALIIGNYDGESDQSNGAGKSALLEAIAWALCDKSRHKKKDGVVKWDKKSCTVEFEFEIDGMFYKIIRSRDKTIGESDVAFFQNSNGEWQNISCDNNSATNDKILNTIGFNYEVFINSVYFKQNDISLFADATASKRKDILKSVLKMDKWDIYQKKAREKARDIQKELEEKQQRLISLEELTEQLDKNNEYLSQLKKLIKEQNEKYIEHNKNLLNKKIEFNALFGNDNLSEKDLKNLQKEFCDAKKRINEIKLKKQENEKKSIESSDSIKQITKKIIILKEKIIAGKGIDLNDLRSKLITGRTKEKVLKEKLLSLEKDIEIGNECDFCKKSISKKDAENILLRRKKDHEELKIKYEDIFQKLKRAETKLKEKEILFDEATKAEIEKGKMELKLLRLQTILSECSEENKRITDELKKLEARDFEKEIDELQNKLNKELEQKLKNEINEQEKVLQNIKKQLDQFNVEFGYKSNEKQELLEKEKIQKELHKDVNKLKEDFTVFDKLREYFGKDGVQSIIIENVIEELENYSNEILSKICNEQTSLSIETQKQTEGGSWSETFDINVKIGSRTDDLDTYSGGEQFRVSLALRLALSNILTKRMGGVVKFLLLDEISSSLDKKGLDMFINIVKQLSSEMKILVITHDERLKEKFDNLIIVDKTATGSKAYVA